MVIFLISFLIPLVSHANVAFADLVPTMSAFREGTTIAIPIALLLEIILYRFAMKSDWTKSAIEVTCANAFTMLVGYLIIYLPMKFDSTEFNLIFLSSMMLQVFQIFLLYIFLSWLNYFLETKFIKMVFKTELNKTQRRYFLGANFLSNLVTFVAIPIKLSQAGFD
jgi:hypothetical protein